MKLRHPDPYWAINRTFEDELIHEKCQKSKVRYFEKYLNFSKIILQSHSINHHIQHEISKIIKFGDLNFQNVPDLVRF